MNLINFTSKSDVMGATASALCLVHCLAAPFLFVAQAGVAIHGEGHPHWWGVLDLVFLVISLVAVYWSAKHTSKRWVYYAFWSSWLFLTFVVMNEKLSLAPLPEVLIFIPTVALIFIHLYNRKYCGCKDEACCVPESPEKGA